MPDEHRRLDPANSARPRLLVPLRVLRNITGGTDPRAARAWPPAIPDGLRRFIGIAELAGALGLILPALSHILPWLTILAALCLALVTILASIYHLRRKEPPFPAVIAVLCLVLAYLRWQVVPLSS
jgi:uncharacterized membrane protein